MTNMDMLRATLSCAPLHRSSGQKFVTLIMWPEWEARNSFSFFRGLRKRKRQRSQRACVLKLRIILLYMRVRRNNRHQSHLLRVSESHMRILVRSCQQPSNMLTGRSIVQRKVVGTRSRVIQRTLPASETLEDLKVQVLHYLLLGEAGFDVVVQSGGGVY